MSGVRNLEREIKVFRNLPAESRRKSLLLKYLQATGKIAWCPKFFHSKEKYDEVGIATAIAWTEGAYYACRGARYGGR